MEQSTPVKSGKQLHIPVVKSQVPCPEQLLRQGIGDFIEQSTPS
jgi:hypothetical protein